METVEEFFCCCVGEAGQFECVQYLFYLGASAVSK